MQNTTNALALDNEWSIGEPAYAAVVAQLRPLDPKTMVEFGSGVSTIRLALDFPGAEIYAIEHDQRFFQKTRELQAQSGVANVRILYCPLTYSVINFRVFQTYKIYPRDLPSNIDAVLIDGPPYFTLFGREACLLRVHDRLRVGGVAVLDDYYRAHEKRAVENWLRTYPRTYDASVLDVGHGLCVLKKIGNAPRSIEFAQVVSNYRHAGAHLLRRLTR